MSIEEQIKEIRQVGFNLLSIKVAIGLINNKHNDSDLEGLVLNIDDQINILSSALNGESLNKND